MLRCTRMEEREASSFAADAMEERSGARGERWEYLPELIFIVFFLFARGGLSQASGKAGLSTGSAAFDSEVLGGQWIRLKWNFQSVSNGKNKWI